MKTPKKNILMVLLLLPLLIIVFGFLVMALNKSKGLTDEEKLMQSMYIDLLDIHTNMNLSETNDYIVLLTKPEVNQYNVSNYWNGIDRREKEKVWKYLETARGIKERCEEIPLCFNSYDFNTYITAIINALESNVKAFEAWSDWKVEEGNQLFQSSKDFINSVDKYNFDLNYEYLTFFEKEKYFNTKLLVVFTEGTNGGVLLTSTCPDVKSEFHNYARYQSKCNVSENEIEGLREVINDITSNIDEYFLCDDEKELFKATECSRVTKAMEKLRNAWFEAEA